MKFLNTALIAGAALAAVLGTSVVAQTATTKVPAEVKSGAYVLDPMHGRTTWTINHLGFSHYTGAFTGIKGTLQLDSANPSKSVVVVAIDPASVGTLNPALDTHLKSKDFLDVATFPTAGFKSTSVTKTGANTADIKGDLTLHGVTKPIVIKATFNQAGLRGTDKKYDVGFDGVADIKRSEFGITTYLPVLGDDVHLHIEAEFMAAS
jgi:polyisoprenoid-binding protein YceI